MKSARVIIAVGILLLMVVGCYWLIVVHPVVPVALISIGLLVGYLHVPQIIDWALGNTNRRNQP